MTLPTMFGKILFEIINRRLAGENICDLARLFHEGLAEWTAATIFELSEGSGIKTVALSGGVFQNSLLVKLLSEKLRRGGLKVLRHELIPANDGGICLGQAIYASNA